MIRWCSVHRSEYDDWWDCTRCLAREPYERPTVTRVRLDAKEMAVSACKVRGGPAGPAGSCRRVTHGACRGQGS